MPATKRATQNNAFEIAKIIANELSVKEAQVAATIELIEEGASVPFIARYRKERTGGLDDTQLRTLSERYNYLTELVARRGTILATISEQGKLTPALEKALSQALTKTELEDLYRPYKPRRRTKATIARENGLEPLADALLSGAASPVKVAKTFLNKAKNIDSPEIALEGARDILIERMVETPEVVRPVRDMVWNSGELSAQLINCLLYTSDAADD